jgi:hypothetical protein
MLRASVTNSDADYDLTAVTGKTRGDGGIPHAQLLCDFAEAVAQRDAAACATLRREIAETMGEAALVDAAAAAAAFHGFVRVADATGIPPEKAGGGQVTMAFREELGINDFYKVRGAGKPGDG